MKSTSNEVTSMFDENFLTKFIVKHTKNWWQKILLWIWEKIYDFVSDMVYLFVNYFYISIIPSILGILILVIYLHFAV